MDLIFYYALQKIKLLFDPKGNFWRFIGIICLIFLSFFYGFAVSILADSPIPEASQLFSFQIISLIIFFATIFWPFFPSYKPLKSPFYKFYPISPFKRFVLNHLNELISVYYICTTIFIAAIILFSANANYTRAALLFASLLTGHLVSHLLQTVIENKISPAVRNLFFISILFFLLLGAALFHFMTTDYLLFVMMILVSILSVISYLLEVTSSKEVVLTTRKQRPDIFPVADMLLRNKLFRIPLILALFFKVSILFGDIILLRLFEYQLTTRLPIVFLFASPLIIFNYLYNNIWGFNKNYWLVTNLANADSFYLFKTYLYLLRVPILIDASISLIYFGFTSPDIFHPGLIMYLTMLPTFILCGFAWSVRSGKNVNSIFSLKSNTSSLGSFTGMAAVLSFLLLPNSGWFYLLIPIYISVAALFFFCTINRYPHQRERLFINLFKI